MARKVSADQFAFDFDIPAAVNAKPAPLAKTKAKKEKLSPWQLERINKQIARFSYRESLPSDDAELLNRAWSELKAYDAAARAADYDGMVTAGNNLKAIGEHAFGMTREEAEKGGPPDGNGRFFCLNDAWRWLMDGLAANDGEIPMFGQKGRFVIELGGCRVDFSYAGMFGICGGDARVVDLDKPFISETGYRSFQVCPDDFVIAAANMDCKQWLERVCMAQLTEGGKKKLKLSTGPFGTVYQRDETGRVTGHERSDASIIENRAKDAAYQEGGHLWTR
jgi:hypothetical protein